MHLSFQGGLLGFLAPGVPVDRFWDDAWGRGTPPKGSAEPREECAASGSLRPLDAGTRPGGRWHRPHTSVLLIPPSLSSSLPVIGSSPTGMCPCAEPSDPETQDVGETCSWTGCVMRAAVVTSHVRGAVIRAHNKAPGGCERRKQSGHRTLSSCVWMVLRAGAARGRWLSKALLRTWRPRWI